MAADLQQIIQIVTLWKKKLRINFIHKSINNNNNKLYFNNSFRVMKYRYDLNNCSCSSNGSARENPQKKRSYRAFAIYKK